MIRRFYIFIALGIIALGQKLFAQTMIEIEESVYLDKLKGGWVGQMAGVTWGAPKEFWYRGSIMPDSAVPVWSESWINNGFYQDDIYVEIPFLDAMKNHGVNCSWTIFGESFKNTTFALWHANYAGRRNLQAGIPSPDSGHYSRNPHCDDIDWQIEADFAGLICPGQINSALELAWRGGHVMNYGDGVYGGLFIAAMHVSAFTAASVGEIIETGRQAVPAGSLYRQVIEDVLTWHAQGKTWEQTWQELQTKWGTTDRCPDGQGTSLNIDAKLNGAYVLIGLLYGNGDFENSMRIAMRCGQDSDCNPSSVGGILGNFYGFSQIPDKWKSALNTTGICFSHTSYTFDGLMNLCRDLALEILRYNGGWVENTTWHIAFQSFSPILLEQWPASANELPSLSAEIISVSGLEAACSASAADDDGIGSYQWFFGDLSYQSGPQPTHTFPGYGRYKIICYASDTIGNTAWRSLSLTLLPDLSGDGQINLADFDRVARHWLTDEPSVDIAPLYQPDGIIDVQDLTVLIQYWLEAAP